MIPFKDDNPTEITPYITVSFIGLCAFVFLLQLSLPPRAGRLFVYQYGAIPAVLFGIESLPRDMAAVPASFSLLTSMFLHGGWMHLLGNMLYLWIFGNNIEDAMGHVRFIIFYILCGIIAAYTHALMDPGSTIPMIGASGAISGVLGAYLLLYPRASCNATAKRRSEPGKRRGWCRLVCPCGGICGGNGPDRFFQTVIGPVL